MDEETWQEPGPEPDETILAPGTPSEVKALAQELLKNGFIESSGNTAVFLAVARLRRELDAVFEPLDLSLDLDELRGLAVLRVADSASATPDEAWSHPLVRRQRLTLEQSLLVAILRQLYVLHELESGIGVREVRAALDELLSQLQVFLPDSGSDTKNRQRLLTLLDQLKPHGIVSEPDSRGEVVIRPLITRLANPETLAALLTHFRGLGGARDCVDEVNRPAESSDYPA
jgi:hypothetical protein